MFRTTEELSGKKILFTLVRHAESEANKSDKLIGEQNIHVKLSDLGELQARLLGRFFKKENFVFTQGFYSTAVCAKKTAKPFLKYTSSSIDLAADESLLEQSAGDWTGQPKALYQQEDVKRALAEDNWGTMPPNGESKHMVALRMKKWLMQQITANSNSKSAEHILVFSHGLAIKYLLAELFDYPRETAYKNPELAINNASITQICYDYELDSFELVTKNHVPKAVKELTENELKLRRIDSALLEDAIARVEISARCSTSNPCRHGVRLTLKNGEVVRYGEASNIIAQKYMKYLSMSAMKHVVSGQRYNYGQRVAEIISQYSLADIFQANDSIPQQYKKMVQERVNELLADVECIKICEDDRSFSGVSMFAPKTERTNIEVCYNDSRSIKLNCSSPEQVTEYFDQFLDAKAKEVLKEKNMSLQYF